MGFYLPWKVWIDDDGKPTQRETDTLLGGQGSIIPYERAVELGLVTKDGEPREPRRGASRVKHDEPEAGEPEPDQPAEEEPADGQ